jgi:hypothetical protein
MSIREAGENIRRTVKPSYMVALAYNMQISRRFITGRLLKV